MENNDQNLIETLVSSTELFNGQIIQVRKDQVRLPDQRLAHREVVDHAPAVVIFPFEPPNTVYLIRQYRHAVEQVMWEIPAGIVDPNEDVQVAAARELREETGLKAGKLEKVGGAYMTPGFCNEFMHFFLATDLTQGDTQFDDDELIDIKKVSLSKLDQWVQEQKINDGKLLLAYGLFKSRLG